MKRKALGRGLGALIPEAGLAGRAPLEIDIDRIDPNPDQPRLSLDEKGLEELAASIRENGVLQPILVRPLGDRYQLVAGERRLAASQRAGRLKIPAVVKEIPDEKVLELALVENIQREQLNPIEEAQAYQALLESLSATQEELASRLGKERSTVANALRLLKLPPPVRQLVAEGKLAAGHARAILASGAPPAEMAKMGQKMAGESWSVRTAERWARKAAARQGRRSPPDPDKKAAEDRLCRLLGTKVEIAVRGAAKGSGTIRIHYYSEEDLIRIFGLLTGEEGA